MKTNLVYLNDAACLDLTTSVVATGSDEHGFWLALEASNMHGRGGGQPPDTGVIGEDTSVNDVRLVDSVSRHYVNRLDFKTGDEVRVRVDAGNRMLNTRCHTAGHLVAASAQQILSSAQITRAHQYPGECWVGGPIEGSLPESFKDMLQVIVSNNIGLGLNVKVQGEAPRTVQIGDHPAIPCGGTHCTNTRELRVVTIKYVRVKKGMVKISYEIEADSNSQKECFS